jgi:hypothetical protein
MSSAHIVRAGSAHIAAAECCSDDTLVGVFDDEASKLLRPVELLAEPVGCGDAPRRVLAPTFEPMDENISERSCTSACAS